MTISDIKAWKITEKNKKLLARISGSDEYVFSRNIGWVLVEDWYENPRFIILPLAIFKQTYPTLELTILKIDEAE